MGRLGRVLRRLGRVLERLGLILERLEHVLERLGATGTRLSASRARQEKNYVTRPPSAEPGSPLRRAPGADNNQREERLSAEKLQTLESECRE